MEAYQITADNQREVMSNIIDGDKKKKSPKKTEQTVSEEDELCNFEMSIGDTDKSNSKVGFKYKF